MLPPLTIEALLAEVVPFAYSLTGVIIKDIDKPKKIGDFVQEKLSEYLATKYSFTKGNSTLGIDFPSLNIDVKATRLHKPQSSSRFRSVRQKVFGLGYGIVLFAYEQIEDEFAMKTTIRVRRVVYIAAERTASYSITKTIKELIENDCNQEELEGYLLSISMGLDEAEAEAIAQKIMLDKTINVGYIEMTQALQWRLMYSVAINNAGKIAGLESLL